MGELMAGLAEYFDFYKGNVRISRWGI